MAVLSKQEFRDKWGGKFADNTIQNVDEAMLREFRQDIADTFADVGAISSPTAPDYDAGAIYPKGAVVLFGLPNKLFYQAKLPGLLPAPTPGVETPEWLPVAKPLSPLLPYREMSAQQGRDFASDGLLEPSMLYRFTERVDATTGNPLDDVLVAAVSRHSVAGADAYAIGIDPQTREEYLLAVSYELATDTTSPRTGGGASGYTEAQVDALLAAKGSAQVQAQHTQQLATIAVSSSPVYGFLEAGGAPVGYTSIDQAVADPAAKISYTFNAPVLLLTASNPATGTGWAYATAALGRTLQLADNVELTLPGSDVGSLTFQDFYIESAPGARSGKVRLLTRAPDTTPAAQLPRLSGFCGKPLEFVNGGSALLSGNYVSLIGTGTAFVLEPFHADNVATTIKVVKVSGSSTPAPETYQVLAFTPNVALDFSYRAQILGLSNNVGFGAAVNKGQGAQLRLFLYNAAGTDIALTFPSAWVFLGTRPSVLLAGKRAVLVLECATGSTEADVFAGYADQF
jgi:hypothetical protein